MTTEVIAMGDEEKRPERIRDEVEPQSQDPDAGAGEGQLVGKADEIAGQIARRATGDSEATAHGSRDVEPRNAPAMGETGRGETLSLNADAERTVHPGDELVVKLPGDGAGEGWSYDVEGDGILDVSERAELVVHGERQRHQPATGSTFQFVIRTTGEGTSTVRFERLGTAGGPSSGAIRLRVEVG